MKCFVFKDVFVSSFNLINLVSQARSIAVIVESCCFQVLYEPWLETHLRRWLIPPYRQGKIWPGWIPTSFLRKIRAGIYVATDAVPLAEAKVKSQKRLT